MEKPSQVELLEHYSRREPTKFIQIDVFDLNDGGADSVMRPDEDGHCIFGMAESFELMAGSDVRVFINPNAKMPDVVAMLLKIAQWIDRESRQYGPKKIGDFVEQETNRWIGLRRPGTTRKDGA